MKSFKQFLIESAAGREAEIEKKMRERTEDLLSNQNMKNINQNRLRADIEAEMAKGDPEQWHMNTPALSRATEAQRSEELQAAAEAHNEYRHYSREEKKKMISRRGVQARDMAINDYINAKDQEKRETAEKQREAEYGPLSGGSYEHISELSPEEQKILQDKYKRNQEESSRRYWEQERKEREEKERLNQKIDSDNQETERLRQEIERRRKEEQRLLQELGDD